MFLIGHRTQIVVYLTLCLLAPLICWSEDASETEPFCYPSHPTDVLGWAGHPEGTLVTPEGFLYTGDAEIMFYLGDPPEPINQRVRVLEDGWYPILHHQIEKDSILYEFTLIGTLLSRGDKDILVNFVKVTATNVDDEPRQAALTCGYRYLPEERKRTHRFRRPAQPEKLGEYRQAGSPFDDHWGYRFGEDYLAREHQILYLIRDPQKEFALERFAISSDLESNETIGAGDFRVPAQQESTIIGLSCLSTMLEPGQCEEIEIIVPYQPLPVSFGHTLETIREIPLASVRDRVRDTWREVIKRGMTIDLLEPKVVNTWYANLIYDLIAVDVLAGANEEYVQKVNEFQYDAFWLRDSAYIIRSYDLTDYHWLAEKCLEHFLHYQLPDGNFVSQKGQFDGWGQTLWAFGQHVELTKDQQFARRFFPYVEAAVTWLKEARKEDPLHLMPVTTPGDAELISGHVTGQNFWALLGLRSAISLAESAGETQAAEDYRKEYDDFHAALYDRLEEVTAETDGVIPPGLDGGMEGEFWGNLIGVAPSGVLDPFDPMVTATQKAAKEKFKEGLMTYKTDFLHHYLTTYVTETDLARGDQEAVLEQFYSILAHTTSTHAGWEWSVRAWADRDFGRNLSPHGWFAARFRILLRKMLIREDGGSLHLFSVLSPEWLEKPNARVCFSEAPTIFGKVDARLTRVEPDRVLIRILPKWTEPPEEIVIHIPWYREVTGTSAGELRKGPGDTVLVLPPDEGSVLIEWRKKSEPVDYSYDKAVDDLMSEYEMRATISKE